MAEITLTQAEADSLMEMEKHRADDRAWDYPVQGESISIPLISADRRENFLLDISRGRIDLSKGTYQNRARQVVVLVRLDFGGAPHRNPDDEVILCPHLHLYREGYGAKWAFPVPTDVFHDVSDSWRTLTDFMSYCRISRPPNIRKGLFS